MDKLLPLFREFSALEKKKAGAGLTARELARWTDLKTKLTLRLSKGATKENVERRQSLRIPMKLRVDFENAGAFNRATMSNISHRGIFISTAFPPEIGTQLQVRIEIESTGDSIEVPAEVVSQHVGPGYQTSQLGMGLRFLRLTDQQLRQINKLYLSGLDRFGKDASEHAEQDEKEHETPTPIH